MTKENKMNKNTTMSGIVYKRVLKKGGIPKGYFRPSAKNMAEKLGKKMKISSWTHQEQSAFAAVLVIWGQNSPQIIKREEKKTLLSLGEALFKNKALWSSLDVISKEKRRKNFLLSEMRKGTINETSFFIKKEKEVSISSIKKEIFKDPKVSYKEETLWKSYVPFKYKYKKGNAEILETPEMMFLDTLSNCCQGFGKVGQKCMIDGVQNKSAGFVAFRENGKIYAQGWIREVSPSILLIDSIEQKGVFRSTLKKDLLTFSRKMKKHYKYVVLGISPNREDLSASLRMSKMKYVPKVASVVYQFVRDEGIYSDATQSIIFL